MRVKERMRSRGEGIGRGEREIAGPGGGSRRDISSVLMSWQSKY